MNVIEGYNPTTNTLMYVPWCVYTLPSNSATSHWFSTYDTIICVTRPNCILQDLFRDIPLDHIWHAQLRAQIRPNTPNTVFGARIWACKIWSSGMSLKRSCKMQLKRVNLVPIGPPSQKLWPNQIFGRFPNCNYNSKLQSGGRNWLMGP